MRKSGGLHGLHDVIAFSGLRAEYEWCTASLEVIFLGWRTFWDTLLSLPLHSVVRVLPRGWFKLELQYFPLRIFLFFYGFVDNSTYTDLSNLLRKYLDWITVSFYETVRIRKVYFFSYYILLFSLFIYNRLNINRLQKIVLVVWFGWWSEVKS